MPLHGLPLTRDSRHTPFCWEECQRLGFEGVHFSHLLCHDAHDLLDDPEWAAEARAWVEDLTGKGLETWVWTHELHRPPKECISADNKFLFDEADWEGHLRRKYHTFLTETLPGITGLVITFAETSYEIYKDDVVVSRHPPAERLRLLMEVLVDIGRSHGVRIVVRDFVYRLNEVHAMAEAIKNLPPEVAVMSKAVPHDWEPFYPPNPILGKCGDREQWQEFDLGLEYEGQQAMPYANLEQTAAWYRHGRKKGIRRFCLRLDRFDGDKGQSALTTPWGQLAIKAFLAWEKDPATPVERIYRDWEEDHFPGAAEAVRLATASFQKMLFPRKNWLANHCKLPGHRYAKTHLVDGNADRLATWTGKPEDHADRIHFMRMPRAFRLSLENEAAESLALYGRADRLVAENLDPDHPAALSWRNGYRVLGSYLRLFAAYRKAFFLLREREENPRDAESPETISKAIDALAEVGEAEAPHWENLSFTRVPVWETYGKERYDPANPSEGFLHSVVTDLRQVLAKI